jgi:methylmalonyl-CoA epimerase
MQIHHIAIAVRDLDDALSFYRDALGVQVSERYEVPAEGVEIAFLPVGNTELELLEPLEAGNSIDRFLEKRGEGIHHICMLVDDIVQAIAKMQQEGVRMATEIRSHADGTQYAFVHPKSSHGVLLELYQKTPTS